jgi:hypothetical protein
LINYEGNVGHMTDTAKLNNIIKDSGLKKQKIAEIIGITPNSLSRKIKNLTEFKGSEIQTLSTLLKVNTIQQISEVFFTQKSE